MKSLRTIFLIIIMSHSFLTLSHAAHPLITDDAGTQGKGKYLFELNGQTGNETERSADGIGANGTAKEKETELRAALTYGINDNVDLILTTPTSGRRRK
jgi:hypothetical protein